MKNLDDVAFELASLMISLSSLTELMLKDEILAQAVRNNHAFNEQWAILFQEVRHLSGTVKAVAI